MQKKTIISFVVFLFFLNVFAWQEVFALTENNNLKVDFLDVGQGDSAFIETPEMHQILIDGGPDSTVLQKLQNLMPFFDRSIDLIILTHPERDHIQGLIDILQRYEVDYILWTGIKRNNPEFQKWISILDRAKKSNSGFLASLPFVKSAANVITAKTGMKIKAGSAVFDILYPLENLSGKEFKNTSNDTGVVSRLIFGKNSFLFTGDISSAAEKVLANSYESANLKSDVLKVAHHGSKYSTSDIFLSAVKPRIAVISVGAKNTYGHPTAEVLQRLEKFGIKVLRTDINGDIKFLSDGSNIKLLNY